MPRWPAQGLLTCGRLPGIWLVTLPLRMLLVHHIIEVLHLRQLPLSLKAADHPPLQPTGRSLSTLGLTPPLGQQLRREDPAWEKKAIWEDRRWAGGQGRERVSDLIGGYSPEVQVGVSGGRVQPILGYISMHILGGCL